MYPTLPSHLSYNVFSRRHKHGKNVQVGDLIVFHSPIFPGEQACKRIIGMPGDYVLRDPGLSPTVGGAPVPGFGDADTPGTMREEPVMVQVPEGHVWVSGDNLRYSRDSRTYGAVPMALIQGKTVYIGDGKKRFAWTSFRGPQLQPATQAPENLPQTPQEITREGG